MTQSLRQRLADAALAKALRAPKPRNQFTVETVQVPMRDGVTLAAEHYAPVTPSPRGTVLIRTPYGRGFPVAALNGRMFAARGYHVLLQSVRGTFGSGGTFEPMAQETDDGQDTVAWLRDQPWYDSRLAVLGASYQGWAQWALLQEPPSELRAVIVYVGPHDFRRAVFGRGAFTLGDFLGWSYQVATQEDGSALTRLWALASGRDKTAAVLPGLPLADAAEPLLRGRAPWYRQWLSHPDADDPWWQPYRAEAALSRIGAPVLLVGGWQDLFLDQTLDQYALLHERGIDVALTVGPWTHIETVTKGGGMINTETLDWLDTHLTGAAPVRKQPVRVYRTGAKTWQELPEWPPATVPATYRLQPDGTLAPDDAVASPEATASFVYDPRNPTPSLGGRVLSGSMGIKDQRDLEARPDVLTFTSPPLATALDITGSPTVELAVEVDNPYADVFVRLCDVDERGRSHNFSDVLLRLDPTIAAGTEQHLTLELDACFHRLLPGHRLRLQVSGGSFPRYARNLGTDGTPADGNVLKPSTHTLHLARTRISLPLDAASTTP